MTQDAYEATNIASTNEVLHRDKVVSRFTAFACIAMALLLGGVAIGGFANGSIAGGIGLAVVSLASLFLALTRSVLRTVVTKDDLRIHWGLWGPRIALDAITSMRTRSATRQEMIKAAAEAGKARIEIFQIPTPGDVLEIEWTDETGKARRAWVGANDARGLQAAIERARSGSRARIDASEIEASEVEASSEADAVAEAEREAQAALEAADQRATTGSTA